jgi:hypothetical protein
VKNTAAPNDNSELDEGDATEASFSAGELQAVSQTDAAWPPKTSS